MNFKICFDPRLLTPRLLATREYANFFPVLPYQHQWKFLILYTEVSNFFDICMKLCKKDENDIW